MAREKSLKQILNDGLFFQVPVLDSQSNAPTANDHELQLILMKALFCVAETHSVTLFSTTFSPQLLTTLLRLLQAPDQDVRLLVLQTFQVRQYFISTIKPLVRWQAQCNMIKSSVSKFL